MEPICSTNECYKLANSALLCPVCPKLRCCSKFCTESCFKNNYSSHKKLHNNDLLGKKYDEDLHRFEELKNNEPLFFDSIIACNPHYRNRLTRENMGCSNIAQCLAVFLSSQQFWNGIENDLMHNRASLFSDRVDSLRVTMRKTNRPTVYTCILTCGATANSLTHYFTIVQDLTNAGIWSFRLLYQAYNEGTEQNPAPVYTFGDWLAGNVPSLLYNSMDSDSFDEEFLRPLDQLMLEDTSPENFRTLWVRLFVGFGDLSRNGRATLNFWRGNLTAVYAK